MAPTLAPCGPFGHRAHVTAILPRAAGEGDRPATGRLRPSSTGFGALEGAFAEFPLLVLRPPRCGLARKMRALRSVRILRTPRRRCPLHHAPHGPPPPRFARGRKAG